MTFLKHYLKTFFKADNFLLAILGLGLIFLFWGGRSFWVYFADEMNSEVSGTVIQSKALTHTSGEKTRTVYRFEYEYVWQGKTYTSKRYSYKNEGDRDGVLKYRPNAAIQVFVNPDKPEQSIIVKGWSWLNLIWVIVGLAISTLVLFGHASMTRDALLEKTNKDSINTN